MPRCLPIEADAACLSCSRTRTSPLGPCEIWGIAAAMSGSISSLGTMLTRGRSTRVTWTTPSLALAHFLILARDHFVAPGHRLADVAEADLREFAQDLLNRDLGALGPAAQDFRNSCRNLRRFGL